MPSLAYGVVLALASSVALGASIDTHVVRSDVQSVDTTTPDSLQGSPAISFTPVPLPQYGAINLDGSYEVAVCQTMPADTRDSASMYVCGVTDEFGATLAFHPFADGYLAEIVNNANGPCCSPETAVGWYLGVHEHYPLDMAGPDYKLIAHKDVGKAGIWQLVENPDHPWVNFLMLARNLDGTGQNAVGAFLTSEETPETQREHGSVYLTVTLDISKAKIVLVQ